MTVLDSGDEVIISVVVPTCDRPDQLANCLRLLAPGVQTLDPARYEVIVSDNSTRASVQHLLSSEFPFVRWIEGPKTGPAENRNYGAAVARGRLLAFIDDDCLPDSQWLDALAAAAAKAPNAVLEGRTHAGRQRRSLAEESPINESGGNLWSCNFAIPRNQFLRIGGFDSQYPYGMEDIDLHIRCRNEGWPVEFVPAASVCHPWRIAPGWKSKMVRRSSLLVFMDKHPDAKHFRSLRFWLGSMFWTCVHDVVKDGWTYRGAGLWHPIERVGFQLVMIWTLCVKRPPYGAPSRLSIHASGPP